MRTCFRAKGETAVPGAAETESERRRGRERKRVWRREGMMI